MQVTIKATKPVWSDRKVILGHSSFFYSLVKHTDLEYYSVTLTDLMVYTFHPLNRTDDGHAELLNLHFKTILDTTFNQLAYGKMEH